MPEGKPRTNARSRSFDNPYPVFEDAASVYGTSMFTQTAMSYEGVQPYKLIPSTYAGDAISGDVDVSHNLISTELGTSTDIQIIMSWEVDRYAGYAMQISPCFGIDLNAANPLEMGVLPVWDITLNGFYFQNGFRSNLSDCLDPAYYDSLGGGSPMSVPETPMRHWWDLRVTGGFMQARFNGEVMSAPVAIPAFAVGRDGWGIHMVGIALKLGRTYFGTSIKAVAPQPQVKALTWVARPYTTPLV